MGKPSTRVSFALADFITGGPIVELPIMPGAMWAPQLGRPDQLACSVDLRDRDAQKLDLRAASEPMKTVMIARLETGKILAWGLVNDDRDWNEDAQTVSLSATGIEQSWLGSSILGPVSALTDELVINGVPNPALDTALNGYSLGTIGKKLVEQRLAWPGSPLVMQLPPDEIGTRERYYPFADQVMIQKRLNDLTNVENGPDFAYDAGYAGGTQLVYTMRHGSETEPRLGSYVGTWDVADTTGLHLGDNSNDLATNVWMTAGRNTADGILMSLTRNDQLLVDGYPSLDSVDKTHSDVILQETLNAYGREGARWASSPRRKLSFSVRGDAVPALGSYAPGDTLTIGFPKSHHWQKEDVEIRLSALRGDETGESIAITCEVI